MMSHNSRNLTAGNPEKFAVELAVLSYAGFHPKL